MAELVNLRGARKAKLRAETAAKASANRAKFGEAKAQKTARKDEQNRAERELAGKRRDDRT